jgi:SAM-dependent methyltransferase
MQKVADASFLAEIGEIYGTYALYHQSEGAEQPIFCGNGGSVARSEHLAGYVQDRLGLPDKLALLDFGCGTGSALRTFSARHPGWTLHGAELSDANLATLKKIPGFAALFTCPPENIPRNFDLITLIHSLEHVLDPVATLAVLAGRLAQGGHIFVQVPDCGSTPYDLAIADHVSHFTLTSLGDAARMAGCKSLELSNSVLPKELTWIGSPGTGTGTEALHKPRDSAALVAVAHRRVEWLADQVRESEAIARRSPQFGIFGTSISGTWLYAALGERVRFFVDEDPARVGRTHMGLPIVAPDAIPAGADVYIPLIPKVAAAVAARLSRHGVRCHLPPAIELSREEKESVLT